MTSNNKSAYEQFEAGEIDANTLAELVLDTLNNGPCEENLQETDTPSN